MITQLTYVAVVIYVLVIISITRIVYLEWRRNRDKPDYLFDD